MIGCLKYRLKSIFDFTLVIAFLPLWLPLLLLLAIVIKITEFRYPIFFIQERVGRNCKLFRMIKFRTMIPNSGANTVTTSNDKRITPLGSFLRKWKLDELPQLINIIKGEMSLVGPRPDVPGYVDQLKGEERLILKLKPGITGPASLKYSCEEELLAKVDNPQWYNDHVIFPNKVKINLLYYHHYTIWMDIKLIIRTFIKN